MTEVTKIQDAAPVEVAHSDPIVSIIDKVAQAGDIEALERMLEMKKQLDADRAREAFAAAFALASAKFPTIPLNGTSNNGQYATLKDIIGHTRPALAEHGLALTFSIEVTDTVQVTAELMHKDGHCKSVAIDLPRETSGSKNAVQAVGSSQTYGQRYTAQAVLGLSLGDDAEDDGDSSGTPKTEKPPAPRDPWTHTIVSEMPEDATPRDKAMAIASALCSQFQRMKGARQLGNEWDRRRHLIEGANGFEAKHPDLHETVVDAYENRMNALTENA